MPAPNASEQALAAALRRSEPLTGLLKRVRASQERLEAIAGLLPAGLRGGVRAGPLDDTAWLLLVANAAAAAKLRQLLPSLEQALLAQGWVGPPIKIKVQARALT